MTRHADPRRASRRGNDNSDLGYGVAADVADRIRTYHAPTTIVAINATVRQVNQTGRCAICGAPAVGGGVTCKTPACIRAWVLGR